MSTMNESTSFIAAIHSRRPGRLFHWLRSILAVPSSGQNRALNWTKWILMRLALVIGAVLLTGAAYQFIATRLDAGNYPAPGQMVDVGGYRLHLNCTGEGAQTVVLEAGLGGGMLDWSLVQPELAKFTRVCSYDRAGIGWSEVGMQPRDSRQIVQELHTLLKNAGLQPPFVFVGHSLGGVNVQLYASQYPDEVAGLVLVDSSHENQFLRSELPAPSPTYALIMKALAPVGVGRIVFNLQQSSANISPELKAEQAAIYSHTGHMYAVADEIDRIAESLADLRAHPMRLGDKPLIVLTHGKAEDMGNAEGVWQELQAELATRSTHSQHIIAKNSGHYIQFDEPDLVIEAVRQVVNTVGK